MWGLPTQHRLQAGTEELGVQRALTVALDVDHGGRTGDQVLQPGLGGSGLKLLCLAVADVEHQPLQATLWPVAAHLPAQPIPTRVGLQIVVEQAQGQLQVTPLALQLPKGQLRCLAISGVYPAQPLAKGQLRRHAKTLGQSWVQLQVGGNQSPLPPPGAQLYLQTVQTLALLFQLERHQPAHQRLGVSAKNAQCLGPHQRRTGPAT
ncbi:hypothetical protein D3C80_1287240 [compost metagenome]